MYKNPDHTEDTTDEGMINYIKLNSTIFSKIKKEIVHAIDCHALWRDNDTSRFIYNSMLCLEIKSLLKKNTQQENILSSYQGLTYYIIEFIKLFFHPFLIQVLPIKIPSDELNILTKHTLDNMYNKFLFATAMYYLSNSFEKIYPLEYFHQYMDLKDLTVYSAIKKFREQTPDQKITVSDFEIYDTYSHEFPNENDAKYQI